MSITFGNLKTQVASAMRDPNGKTFTPTIIGNIIQSALATIGRVAPEEFQEDLTPVADVLEYTLRSAAFDAEAVPEIEVKRVEVWDGSQTPAVLTYAILSAGSQPLGGSQDGWTVWNGKLQLPSWIVKHVIGGHEDKYLIRVWGYSPYAVPSADGDTIAISNELQWAMMDCCRVEALARLVSDRTLFTQWQTRSGNTDASFAGMMNELNMARDNWRKVSREIQRLRVGS